MNTAFFTKQASNKNVWIFSLLWLLTFILYIPAVKAGWVIDAAGFLYGLKHDTFWDFINRTHSEDQSFYQLFMFHYYLFYKLWGLNLWLWSLLYITLQSLNAYLLFLVSKAILADSGVKDAFAVSLVAAFLFTINPHISEVVICKAYYHYLQSFFFILLIMLWVVKYQHSQQSKYIWSAAILFFLCAFTLEIFYLIPFFVLSIALYYSFALGYDRSIMKKTTFYFFIPQVVILCLYFVALYLTFKFLKPHKIEITSSIADYLSKPPKYLFHIVFLGRYFPLHVKSTIYAFCRSPIFLIIFYSLGMSVFLYSMTHLKKLGANGKAMFLFGTWSVLTIAFVVPLAFPDAGLLVFYDRYTYFSTGFVFMVVALAINKTANKYIFFSLFSLYSCINLYFTVTVNTWWKHSAYVINRLMRDLPLKDNKIIVLLNIPENLNGIPMIGARPEGQFTHMRQIFLGTSDHDTIYDAASYNMASDNDGAHVNVLNDSTIRVTLNQWGTWWWYDGHGAGSYQNKDYRLDMKDAGHYYDLILKSPPANYHLFYNIGSNWKAVDMNKKNGDQY